MVAYQDFVALCQSADSEERGRAAHLAALAYLGHDGPAEEHAALYAALIGFLDDSSVKVRAALAYGLLHAREAPRPILLALLQDSAVIARAIVQYSPALIDADLTNLIRTADPALLFAFTTREQISQRVAEALVARAERPVTLALLQRPDVTLTAETLLALAESIGASDATVRGTMLARRDLPPAARLKLLDAAAIAIARARIVKGALAPKRLERILRDLTDTALTAIGEECASSGETAYAARLIAGERISTRLMLHSVINGHVLFFASCLAGLAETAPEKVFTLLETGSRPALTALLSRCGLPEHVRNLLVRLVVHAREADLADDVTARHFVVTALTEELIVEHDGAIPPDLEDAFNYLSEQNVTLARRAARGVMASFAGEIHGHGPDPMPLPAIADGEQLTLPAA
jgi:uncharacterized protein (DUF2336 family)